MIEKDSLKVLVEKIVEYSPKVLVGIVIILVSWIIANLLKRILVRLGSRLDDSKRYVVRLCAAVCKWIVLAVGIITGLGTMNVNVSALVAGLGLTGFALGFALKDAISNLMSGVLLLVYQPFNNGDWISVSGCEGKVIEINMRYTVIEKEKDKYLIPNSTLLTNTVRVADKI